MKKKLFCIGMIAALLFSMTGCGNSEEEEVVTDEVKTISFVDAQGEYHELTVDADVEENAYTAENFVLDGQYMTYEDDNYTSSVGVDVSKFQGDINWKKVAAAGIEYAFIRVGYRGYSEGKLNLDKKFKKNIKGALKAGLDVGVYFFSQAISEEEAIEEAEFVMDAVEGYDLQLPIVYDPESILNEEARTDDVSAEQFTKNTVAFCKTIKEGGYDAMVYANLMWQAYKLDLGELTGIPMWYADYEAKPQTPYHFEYWQYTDTGSVDGISGDVDLDIRLIKK
ncbi:MAG: glycoside hydrolase family 25 protein [Eubacterium sp.]|nr:glycoside hydrolase family 25 protein [Eubacterium sp.]